MRVCLFLLAVVSVTATAQVESRKPHSGYFSPGALNLVDVIPPAPVSGDARDQSDRAIFNATRSLEGTARWVLAHNDDALSVDALLQDFSCAMGTHITKAIAPKLAALLARVSADSKSIDKVVKERYRRQRPFLLQSGPICIARSGWLSKSFEYPSGHTSLGWLTGLILAELQPDRAAAILVRARAYGESRIVCGVHTASAVESGRVLGGSIFGALQGLQEFRTDMEQARGELTRQLTNAHPLAGPTCLAETAVLTASPFSGVSR